MGIVTEQCLPTHLSPFVRDLMGMAKFLFYAMRFFIEISAHSHMLSQVGLQVANLFSDQVLEYSGVYHFFNAHTPADRANMRNFFECANIAIRVFLFWAGGFVAVFTGQFTDCKNAKDIVRLPPDMQEEYLSHLYRFIRRLACGISAVAAVNMVVGGKPELTPVAGSLCRVHIAFIVGAIVIMSEYLGRPSLEHQQWSDTFRLLGLKRSYL